MKSKTKRETTCAPAEMASETVKLTPAARVELAALSKIFPALPMAQLASQALLEIGPIWRERGAVHFKATANQQEHAA